MGGNGSGNAGGAIELTAGIGASGFDGGALNMFAGNGNGIGNGGATLIQSGNGGATTGALAGYVDINAGNGAGINAGGITTLRGGQGGPSGDGGHVLLQAGSGGATVGFGGHIIGDAGSGEGSADGGIIGFNGGYANGIGNGGGIFFFAGGASGGNGNGGNMEFSVGLGFGAGLNGVYKFWKPDVSFAHILNFDSLTADRTLTFQDDDGEAVIKNLGNQISLNGDVRLRNNATVRFSTDTPATATNFYMTFSSQANDTIKFEQASASAGNELVFNFAALTAERTVTFPDQDMTWASGVYTPTLTGVANTDAVTAFQCQFSRVGSVVTVSGKLNVDPTAAATQTQVGISLPIASNIGAEEDVGGTASAKAIVQVGGIYGDATNNRAELSFLSGATADTAMHFSFTYRII